MVAMRWFDNARATVPVKCGAIRFVDKVRVCLYSGRAVFSVAATAGCLGSPPHCCLNIHSIKLNDYRRMPHRRRRRRIFAISCMKAPSLQEIIYGNLGIKFMFYLSSFQPASMVVCLLLVVCSHIQEEGRCFIGALHILIPKIHTRDASSWLSSVQ